MKLEAGGEAGNLEADQGDASEAVKLDAGTGKADQAAGTMKGKAGGLHETLNLD